MKTLASTIGNRALLSKLVIAEAPSFRHRMGVSRLPAADFYTGTEEAKNILEEKQQILVSPVAGQHLLEDGAGWSAFREFVQFAGAMETGFDLPVDHRTANLKTGLAMEPDYLLMLPSPNGWRLAWANVCFPTRWSLVGKCGQSLDAIHSVVPGLNGQLGRKIDVFFERLEPGEGWGRANWGLSSSAARNQHPTLPYESLTSQTPLESVWLRMESQHLCKLPETGVIAFGIRIVNFPMTEILGQSEIAAGLREQLRMMPKEIAEYKGIPPTLWQRL